MKKVWKAVLVVVASLALLACAFAVYVFTGNPDVEAFASMSELDSLSPRMVRAEDVPVITQPDGFTCGVTTIAITVSALTGENIAPLSLIEKYSLSGGMKSDAFADLLAKELPGYAVNYAGNLSDTGLLMTIHGQLAEGIPVPVFFGAENPYNKPWYDFHASVVTGLDLDRQEVVISNAYGYEETIGIVEFLNRMSYRGGSKYPFVQRAVARLGLMDINAIAIIKKN